MRRLFCHPLPALQAFLAMASFMAVTGAATPLIANPGDTNADTTSGAGLYVDPTNGLGSWIWASNVFDNQTVFLWHSFEIPATPRILRARLSMTTDNEFTVLLDGRELGHGAEWRELFLFDLTPLLSPGRHVLAVKAFNSYSEAGMILGLQIDLANGSLLQIKSGDNWMVVPGGVKGWEKMTQAAPDWPAAVVEAPLGGLPWWTRPQSVNIMPTLHPLKVYFWQSGWFQIMLLTICGITVVTSLSLAGKLALHRKERILLKRERSRIARDIHDDIGSKITQLVLHGEVAQNEFPTDPQLRAQLDLICHDARDVLSVLDEVLWAVNPKRDELRDFTAYVCHYAEQFLKFTSIQCFLDVATEAPTLELSLPLRRSLLMVTKEALNNAVKHSRASELRLQIRCEHGRLTLSLSDNGKGFDPAKADRKRNGLNNMTKRMAEFGGNCVVTSQPGKGCSIELSVPLKQSRWQFWKRSKEIN
jgi:signal transduction histidine kinase